MDFTTKNKWYRETNALCLHCGGEIKFRPCTVGLTRVFGAIKTEGLFCCFPCVVTYCRDNKYFENNEIEQYTQLIYESFKKDIDGFDSIHHMQFISEYDRILYLPGAPSRYKLKRYGGHYDNNYVWEIMSKTVTTPRTPTKKRQMHVFRSD